MISLVRVDNRLIHGQVVEAWLPHLKVARVVVADDEAANSPLIRAAMGLAVSPSVEVDIRPLAQVDFAQVGADGAKTLVLLRTIQDVVAAVERGLRFSRLNLGNVHFEAGRRQVSPSVFLSRADLDRLKMLAGAGAEVEARAVPSDRPVTLADMSERFGKDS
ncbi:MAG TPA: PTS sugar transporter subunit IIB [Myxococcaceae bacterium]|nr:PTS sugar transporter subunit IIB [Myxococcaceae bacterium]